MRGERERERERGMGMLEMAAVMARLISAGKIELTH
jgi:hypothetical protein